MPEAFVARYGMIFALAVGTAGSGYGFYEMGKREGARLERAACEGRIAALPRPEGNGEFFRGPLQPERGNRRF